MKKYKWTIAALIVFLLCWGYDALVCNALRKSPFGEFNKLTKLFEEEMPHDVLIMGSSRAELNFDPTLLDLPNGHSLYNTGLIGTNLNVTKATLLRRLELNHNINTIFLITDFLLWQDPDIDNLTDAPRFLPYLHHDAVFDNLAAVHPKLYAIKYFPPYAATYYNDKYLYAAWRSYQNTPVKADEGTFTATGYRILPEAHAAKFETPVISDSGWVSPTELSALDSIYAICKREGIQVITVIPPVFDGKLEKLNNIKAKGELESLIQKHQSPLLDYTDWQYEDQQDLFFDDIHLNPKGVKLFMQDFQRDLMANLQMSH